MPLVVICTPAMAGPIGSRGPPRRTLMDQVQDRWYMSTRLRPGPPLSPGCTTRRIRAKPGSRYWTAIIRGYSCWETRARSWPLGATLPSNGLRPPLQNKADHQLLAPVLVRKVAMAASGRRWHGPASPPFPDYGAQV